MRRTILLLFLSAISFTNLTHNPQAGYGFYDKYYIGILGNGLQHNYNYFRGLGLNLWMHYTNWWDASHGIHSGWTDWEANDYLTANKSEYQTGIENVLMLNSQNNYRSVSERVKLSYLCYGQRSDYQCEEGNINPYYDFYAFANHNSMDEDYQDFQYNNGDYVRYCPLNSSNRGINPAHLVVWNLKANREQVNTHGWSHPYEIDSLHNFIIKPRIRIPQAFVTPENLEVPVCRIKVYNWNGPPKEANTILNVIIKVKYLTDENFQYDGTYKEEFNFHQDSIDLIIDNLTTGYNQFNPDNHSILEDTCNVDIQVEWLGNCDMWIDYVRVDDEIAHRLLKGNDPEYESWLQREAQLAEYNDNPLKFYIEEFEFNNVPCIAYVNQKLYEYSNHKYKLMCCLNIGEYYWRFTAGTGIIHFLRLLQPIMWIQL